MWTWVYVKLQPYFQVSLSATKYHKLELLIRSRIHNVFHFSLLKPHLGLPLDVIDQIPHESVGNHPWLHPWL